MILAEDEKTRCVALGKLLPMQRADFVELFKIMGGLPVTIRLLDPPLHEFLPHSGQEEFARWRRPWAPIRRNSPDARASCTSSIRCSASAVAGWRSPIRSDGNAGPRHVRGPPARLPKRPAVACEPETHGTGHPATPGIRRVEGRIVIAFRRSSETGKGVKLSNIRYGTMIELPRASLRAGEIAETARVFSSAPTT